MVEGDAVIGGRFSGTFDFGDGRDRKGEDAGFLLNLGR